MQPVISTKWRFRLDLEAESLDPVEFAEAFGAARDADCGVLSADGVRGDWAALEFEGGRSEVWYKRVDGFLMRPCFPHRQGTDQNARTMFLERRIGFRLFAEVIRRAVLPTVLPPEREAARVLPGMEDCLAQSDRWRLVEWRVQGHVRDSV